MGKKGRDVIKRDLSEHFVDHVDLSEIKTVRYTMRRGYPNQFWIGSSAGEFDVATLFIQNLSMLLLRYQLRNRLFLQASRMLRTATHKVNYEYEPSEEEILLIYYQEE